MLALAHVFQRMIDAGVVANQTELARLTGFSNARITQLMNLTLLAPSIQEEILGMTVESGRDKVTERSLRKVVRIVEWGEQETEWRAGVAPCRSANQVDAAGQSGPQRVTHALEWESWARASGKARP